MSFSPLQQLTRLPGRLNGGLVPALSKRFTRFARSNELTWRYLFNSSPTLSYRINRPALSGEAARILDELNQNGICLTSVGELPELDASFNELNATVEKLEDELRDQITAGRASANDLNTIGQKTFLFKLLGVRPTLDPNNVYVRFALQKPILQIANAYFGMFTRLRDYNVWHTFVTNGHGRESQLWHCGREDFSVLKVFVYLSDVDDGAGPLTYALGTHQKQGLRRAPEGFLEKDGKKRSSDQQMAEVVEPSRWVRCVGPKSTIVFVDTTGYHKGGLAREQDRLLYFCTFVSQASQMRERFQRAGTLSLPRNKEQAFALSAN